MFGATKTYGPQKGLTEDEDRRGRRLPRAVRRRGRPPHLARAGGRRRRRARLRAAGARSTPRTRDRRSSPVPSGSPSGPRSPTSSITGEGAFDFSSRSGKVPYGVAALAAGGAAAVRRAGRAGAGGLTRDAGARRRVGVLDGRPGGGGALLRRSGRCAGRPRRTGGAHLVAVRVSRPVGGPSLRSGPPEHAATPPLPAGSARSACGSGNNRGCATIEAYEKHPQYATGDHT